MYSKLPNLIIGFHGCNQKTYENVICKNKPLSWSMNTYDWLGNGIYFWEQNYLRAKKWAKDRFGRDGAVIGAVLDLGYCLNLMDDNYIPLLKQGYELLKIKCESLGDELPINHLGKDKLLRDLDCAVIEQIHDYKRVLYDCDEFGGTPFDSVRGLFIEGNPVYEGSELYEKTHIQICVRNPNCIKGYFNPLKPKEWMGY